MTVSSRRLDALRPQPQLHLEAALLLLEGHDLEALRLQLRRRGLLVGALDLAALRDPGEVDRLECERGHQAALASSDVGRHLDQLAQLLGARGARLGDRLRDLAGADEARQRGVHRLHAVRRAGLDQRVDLVRLALADQVAHARRRHEDLGGDLAAPAVGRRDERLRDDPLEADRELRADLALLGRREDVDDAVDGLRRVLRVERREDEVAGLGRGQRRADRLHVAHLADEDHVGVLAQGGLERHRERLARRRRARAG